MENTTLAEQERNHGPIRSMTGYAVVRTGTSSGEFIVSLRSVNHRGLDLHFQQNGELLLFENASRELIKRHIARGHVEVRMSLSRGSEAVGFNSDLLKRYMALFQQACAELELDSKPDANMFFSLPGVFESGRDTRPLDRNFESELISALQSCIGNLNDHREREGGELARECLRQVSAIEDHVNGIAAIRAEAMPYFSERLKARLRDLLGDSNITENRVVEEAALLADRSDVQEELTRLIVHANEVRRLLQDGGAIGKQLDFLLQEMSREANTILSKTGSIGSFGLAITNLGLLVKAHIERMREQALNLE